MVEVYLKGNSWVCGSLEEKVENQPKQDEYLIQMFKKGTTFCCGFYDVVGDPFILAKCHDLKLYDLRRLLYTADTKTTRLWLANIKEQEKNMLRGKE